MTTLTRWKLATALLAAIAGYGVLIKGDDRTPNTPAATVSARSGSLPKQYRRPLRLSADAAGIDKGELVARLLSAKTVKDVATLAEKLGIVGDDGAIDSVMPLLKDSRRGVPEAILGAFGQIGTEHAVDILVS